jgi:hypothetical protein
MSPESKGRKNSMAVMGKYCKAYSVQQLREFSQWHEQSENTRSEQKEVDGNKVEVKRSLTDDDFLYLQENYVVTDGIFKDENIIFDQITPEWKAFCQTVLGFKVPVYESVEFNS